LTIPSIALDNTNCQRASAALLQVKIFLSGPARHLIRIESGLESELGKQLIHIYQELQLFVTNYGLGESLLSVVNYKTARI
jgi:hypothetical protein